MISGLVTAWMLGTLIVGVTLVVRGAPLSAVRFGAKIAAVVVLALLPAVTLNVLNGVTCRELGGVWIHDHCLDLRELHP